MEGGGEIVPNFRTFLFIFAPKIEKRAVPQFRMGKADRRDTENVLVPRRPGLDCVIPACSVPFHLFGKGKKECAKRREKMEKRTGKRNARVLLVGGVEEEACSLPCADLGSLSSPLEPLRPLSSSPSFVFLSKAEQEQKNIHKWGNRDRTLLHACTFEGPTTAKMP